MYQLTSPAGLAMQLDATGVTVKVVEPATPLAEVALIVVVPTATPVARPVALTVAVATALEDHVTVLERFCVVLLVKVPVAVNCLVIPATIVGVAGVTAIDTTVGAVTVNVVEPAILPEVAVIVDLPTATPFARPAAVIVAVAAVPELQVTLPVRFCVELSLKVPVAVNCCVSPAASDGLAGVTAMDTSVGVAPATTDKTTEVGL